MDTPLQSLRDSQRTLVDTLREAVKPLTPLLKKYGVSQVNTQNSLVVHTDRGSFINIPATRTEALRLGQVRNTPQVIGVVVTSAQMTDPYSLRVLEPGVYAVRLRPVLSEATPHFALDFLDAKGARQFAVAAEINPDTSLGDKDKILPALINITVGYTASPNVYQLCASFFEIFFGCWNIGKASEE